MKNAIDFEHLRNELALKFPYPSKDRINMEQGYDMNANPHNDNYANKKPRRSEAEIVSDLAYGFADAFLSKQYTNEYQLWLRENTREVWGVNVIAQRRNANQTY